MMEVLKVPGLLFVEKGLCCLKLGSFGLGRQWQRAVQLRSPPQVLRRECCLLGNPTRLMRSNSRVFNVLIDLIDRFSQLHGRPLWLLRGESLGTSRRLARTHIVERFLRKRGFSVLDSWSSFRWRCSTTRVSFLERFSEV